MPNSNIVTDGIIQNWEKTNLDITNINYLSTVKTRGPTKLEYTTATQKFSNAIMLSYIYKVNTTIKKTSIRIYSNGLINLISIPTDIAQQRLLYEKLILRINKVHDSVNLENFNKWATKELREGGTLLEKEMTKYDMLPKLSNIHSLNSQFNMWTDKNKYSIDFTLLNDIISPLDHKGHIVSGEFTNIIDNPKKQIIILHYDKDTVNLLNWELSSGTRDVIRCINFTYSRY